jgi:hypothetical protein
MNNPKARWDKIRFHVPRKVICLRENGKAGLSAIGALKSFNPAVTHHLENMRAQLRGSRVCPDEAAALKRNARARLQKIAGIPRALMAAYIRSPTTLREQTIRADVKTAVPKSAR